MSVKYKLYQQNRTYKDGRQDPSNGKWFARAISQGTIETKDLAEIIQRNCSMKKSDVVAVLTELVEVMTDKLQESYTVKLNDFGTFKVGISCSGAIEPGDFSVSGNVRGTHINFTPSYTVDVATGRHHSPMLAGIKLSETAKNAVGVEDEEDKG